MTHFTRTLLVALAAFLVGACVDDTTAPDLPDNGTAPADVVEPYNDGTTTTTPDQGSVADTPAPTITLPCDAVRAQGICPSQKQCDKGICQFEWHEVGTKTPIQTSCVDHPDYDICEVVMAAKSPISYLNHSLWGTGKLSVDNPYEFDEGTMTVWVEDLHGDVCLNAFYNGPGGVPYPHEFVKNK